MLDPALVMTLFLGAAIACAFFAGACLEYRRQRVVQTYMFIMFLYLGWAMLNLLMILSTSTPTIEFFARMRFLFISPLPPLWAYFSKELFSQGPHRKTSKYFALLFIPTALIFTALSVPSLHHLIITDIQRFHAFGIDTIRWRLGPLGQLHVLYSYLTLSVVIYICTKGIRRQNDHRRHYGKMLLLGLAIYIIPETIGFQLIPETRFLGLPLLSQIFTAVVFYYILRRQQVVRNFSSSHNSLFESLPTPVVLINRDERIALFNSKASHLFNLNFSSVGKKIEEALPEKLLEHWSQIKSQSQNWIFETTQENEEAKYHEVIYQPFAHPALDGQGSLLALNDVTNLKRSTQINQHLLSLMSHDLLGNLSSLTHLVAQKDERYWSLISESSQSSLDLVRNILLWSATQGDLYKASKEPVSVSQAIEIAIEQVRPLMLEKNIQIVTSKYTDQVLFADKKMLLSILRNLLSNALKYAPHQSTIHITNDVTEDFFHLTIIDQGPGMSPELAQKILSQASGKKLLSSADGYGIGLFLVMQFLKLHQGYLSIEPRNDRGFGIKISFPRAFQNSTNTINLENP